MGVRFRISPSTFFQTNTRATALLYDLIGDSLGLPKVPKNVEKLVEEVNVLTDKTACSDKPIDTPVDEFVSDPNDDEVIAKKARINPETEVF